MSKSGDERDIGIFRVHDETADRMRVAKPNKFPGLTSVDGLVRTVSAYDVATDASFSGPDIDYVGVRFGDGERPDGRRSVLLLIENGFPIKAPIRGLPNAACNPSKI